MSTTQQEFDPLAAAADFYDIRGLLDDDERAVIENVRDYMEREVAPLINDYWARAEFPREAVWGLRDLGITGSQFTEHGCPGMSNLASGLISMELSRVDPSVGTFFGVHSGLAMGSIVLCGDEAQKAEWIPKLLSWEKIGAFGLTEIETGSGVALGLQTTATRDGDGWLINGNKKWIGNGTFADVIVVWARDVEDDQVKGFLLETPAEGFTAEKIEGKVALRAVENAVLRFDNVAVPESHRLQNANSFRDTAKVLRLTRGGVAWNSVGCAMGAYEAARAYAIRREQFGRPIASFQLIQDLLAKMLAGITASQCVASRLSALQEKDAVTEQQAAMAKMYCTTRTREVVQWAREVMGGNGILLENDVARFFVDSEALYSYEGTREVNSLIVGRSITGYGAFV